MTGRVFDFDRAIVRQPGHSVIDGLRAGGGPSPTFAAVAAEHAAYVAALGQAGVQVDILPPLERFPDAIFVEDPALVFPQGAILLNPGTETRQGEVAAIAPDLHRHFETVARLDRGHVDGGDILVTPACVYIGLSARTDAEGAEALIGLLDRFGYQSRVVTPPPGVLHLKTASSLADEETLVVTRLMADCGIFDSFRLIIVPEGENEAANLLRVNGQLLVAAQCPRTIDALGVVDATIVPLSTRAVGMIDAGLSCMSLRWRVNP